MKHYEAIHMPLVRYCDSRSYGLMDTEDLVQETVLRTLEGYESIREQSRLLSYMIGMANNICRNVQRSLGRQRKHLGEVGRRLYISPAQPDQITEIELLYEKISELGNDEREAILMFEVSGFAIKEVAEALDRSEGATKTLLSRARGKLRSLMISNFEQV